MRRVRAPFRPRWPVPAALAALAACTASAPAAIPGPAALGPRFTDERFFALPPLVNPDSIVSSGGVLRASLVAAPGTYVLGGMTYTANLYNGLYAPQTLVVNPGDSVQLNLYNVLNRGMPRADTAWTNLHYHGFNVTPRPPGDDVLLRVGNDSVFAYRFAMPSWHRPGLYWYHPHPHGNSEGQVLGGMAGAIVVNGLLQTYFPGFTGVTERVMLLKDHLPPGSPAGAKIKSINGLVQSRIEIQPYEAQLWRFANVSADAYYNLKLVSDTGRVPMLLLARDGNPVAADRLFVDSLLLPPSSRAEVIVGGLPGYLYLISDTVDTGPAGDPNPPVLLAVAGGTGRAANALRPAAPSPAQQALADTIRMVLSDTMGANRRTFVFSENAAGDTFYINNATYDPDSVATYVEVPSTEVWTIQNTSTEVHVFHIHQVDFLVTEINGVPQDVTGFVDTVNLPYSDGVTPTTVKIVLPFTHSIALGEFVYHCHILEHEDGGMMQNIVLYPRGSERPAPRPRSGHRH